MLEGKAGDSFSLANFVDLVDEKTNEKLNRCATFISETSDFSRFFFSTSEYFHLF